MTLTHYTPMVFLGGTCGAHHWREEIVIPGLLARGVAPEHLFNPVVEHWDDDARQREDEAKRTARYMLYVIASPDPHGGTANVSAYSLAELIMSLYDAQERTVALFDTSGMDKHTAKAINKTMQDLRERFPQAPIFTDYAALIDWLATSMLNSELSK
jgi:ADP-heptose:LPS heptosyltransferase